MVDKYQKIIDEEKLRLNRIHDEIDRKTNKRLRILLIVGVILVLCEFINIFG